VYNYNGFKQILFLDVNPGASRISFTILISVFTFQKTQHYYTLFVKADVGIVFLKVSLYVLALTDEMSLTSPDKFRQHCTTVFYQTDIGFHFPNDTTPSFCCIALCSESKNILI
jgi:hypothetical protein